MLRSSLILSTRVTKNSIYYCEYHSFSIVSVNGRSRYPFPPPPPSTHISSAVAHAHNTSVIFLTEHSCIWTLSFIWNAGPSLIVFLTIWFSTVINCIYKCSHQHHWAPWTNILQVFWINIWIATWLSTFSFLSGGWITCSWESCLYDALFDSGIPIW